jgi:hypothetical protein
MEGSLSQRERAGVREIANLPDGLTLFHGLRISEPLPPKDEKPQRAACLWGSERFQELRFHPAGRETFTSNSPTPACRQFI